MAISPIITQSGSIEAVVDAVNKMNNGEGVEYYGGVDLRSGDTLAGEYAFHAADSSDYPVDDDALSAHMDFLAEAGAVFDHAEAMEVARKLAAPIENVRKSIYYLAFLEGEERFIMACETDEVKAQEAGEALAREQGFDDDVVTIGPVKLVKRWNDIPEGAREAFTGDIYVGDDMDHCYGAAYFA